MNVNGVVPVTVSSNLAPSRLLIATSSGEPSMLYGVVHVAFSTALVRVQVNVLDAEVGAYVSSPA